MISKKLDAVYIQEHSPLESYRGTVNVIMADIFRLEEIKVMENNAAVDTAAEQMLSDFKSLLQEQIEKIKVSDYKLCKACHIPFVVFDLDLDVTMMSSEYCLNCIKEDELVRHHVFRHSQSGHGGNK